MQWGDLLSTLESRARRLGIPTKDDDAADLLLAAVDVLQELIDAHDLSAYVVINDAMFTTTAGKRDYPLPADFGRLLHVWAEKSPGGFPGTGRSGMVLYDGTNRFDLSFKRQIDYAEERTTNNQRPSHFTLTGRTVLLNPAPDSNNSANYTGQGIYMQRIRGDTPPDPEDAFLLDEPSAVVALTLFRVASDRGLPQAGALEKEAAKTVSALVNNEARKKQLFYSMRWPTRIYR